ncbi:MAG TPA: hypothetical protein VFK65_24835 [Candidatus Binatia bacterium]|nr:hypothetical protein [Candidatus Binatia bacterium]
MRVVEGDLTLAPGAFDENLFAVGALVESDLRNRRWRIGGDARRGN